MAADAGRGVTEDAEMMDKRGVSDDELEPEAWDPAQGERARAKKAAAHVCPEGAAHLPCGEDAMSKAAEAAADCAARKHKDEPTRPKSLLG